MFWKWVCSNKGRGIAFHSAPHPSLVSGSLLLLTHSAAGSRHNCPAWTGFYHLIAAMTAPKPGQDNRAWPFPVSPCHGRTYLTLTVILSTPARHLSIRAEAIDIGRVSTQACITPQRQTRACAAVLKEADSGEAEQASWLVVWQKPSRWTLNGEHFTFRSDDQTGVKAAELMVAAAAAADTHYLLAEMQFLAPES